LPYRLADSAALSGELFQRAVPYRCHIGALGETLLWLSKRGTGMAEEWVDGHVVPSLHSYRDLDTATGILVMLRGCDADTALQELVQVAQRHRVPMLTLAAGLVDLASAGGRSDDLRPGHTAARQEWGQAIRRLRETLMAQGQ
jgi:ANTAR domain